MWVIASEEVEGRAVSTFADARGSRAEGGIIHHHKIFASGYGKAIATEQRARRWRAAKFPLRDGKINSMDPDSDNDGNRDSTETNANDRDIGIMFDYSSWSS